MNWTKYTIKTTTKDCEMICASLMDFGITDVQIENNIQLTDEEMNQMYADFVKELPEDDGSCTVSFYLDENGYIPEGIGTGDSPTVISSLDGDEDGEFSDMAKELIYVDVEALKQSLLDDVELFNMDPISFETCVVDTADWENKWKEYFKPFMVGDIIIKPTWEEVPEDMPQDKITINIDPGMAFGTGMHETTKLCLEGLQKYMKPGDKVLDLGCGSGILGIGACKLGASSVSAVDIDEQAVAVAEENFELNGCGEACDAPDQLIYDICAGNVLADKELQARFEEEQYDVVLANILADVIVPLSGMVDGYLNPGGIFISSGIIDYKEQEVVDAVNANPALELVEVCADGDWRSVIARKLN